AIQLPVGWARALSPDGKWALVSPLPPFNTLVLVPTGAGEARPLPAGPFAGIEQANLFPDGKRVLIQGGDPNLPLHMWIQDLEGAQPKAVPAEALWRMTAPSPDGKWVAGQRPDGTPVRVSLENGAMQILEGLKPGDSPLQWAADGRSLFVELA